MSYDISECQATSRADPGQIIKAHPMPLNCLTRRHTTHMHLHTYRENDGGRRATQRHVYNKMLIAIQTVCCNGLDLSTFLGFPAYVNQKRQRNNNASVLVAGAIKSSTSFSHKLE